MRAVRRSVIRTALSYQYVGIVVLVVYQSSMKSTPRWEVSRDQEDAGSRKIRSSSTTRWSLPCFLRRWYSSSRHRVKLLFAAPISWVLERTLCSLLVRRSPTGYGYLVPHSGSICSVTSDLPCLGNGSIEHDVGSDGPLPALPTVKAPAQVQTELQLQLSLHRPTIHKFINGLERGRGQCWWQNLLSFGKTFCPSGEGTPSDRHMSSA